MASFDNNQQQLTWVPRVPYETTKDCSQGFCSIYCPQWCYIIFPPPPPFSFDDDNSSGSQTLSPLVIAIIGILASAFLLVSYYTIISKYCGGSFRRRRPNRDPLGPEDYVEDDIGGQSRHHETWHVSPSNGLDEALINKIAVCKYKRGDGLVEGTDCSVCLSEFREDESLRLLPKCSHAFHLQCIDTWLKYHSNCPLCRVNIVLINPTQAQLPPPPPPMLEAYEPNDEMVVVIEDLERGGDVGEEETDLGNDGGASSKEPSESQDENHDITVIRDDDGVQPIRRSVSMDSLHRGRVSIADILQMNMEDEYLVAKDHGLLVGGGSSSRRSGGEHSKGSSRTRGLHSVMSPVPMKRSVSSGRFCFTTQARGRNAILPI